MLQKMSENIHCVDVVVVVVVVVVVAVVAATVIVVVAASAGVVVDAVDPSFFVSGEQKFFNCIVFFNWEENPSRHVNRQVSPLPPSLSVSFFLSQSLRHPNTQASTLCLSLYLYVYGSVIASFGTGSCL